MIIKTNLNEVIKHIDKYTDCFVSENEVKDGFDLIISIPYFDSKIEQLAEKINKKDYQEFIKNERKLI